MAYTVFRSDLLDGINVNAALVSLRVYDVDGVTPIAVENGTIVELFGYEEGQREVRIAKLATSASKLSDCAVVATPEVFYDERKHNLDEFINEANTICRGYELRPNNMFSVTKDGFVGQAVAIEIAGRYTYYVIKVSRPA